MFKLELDLVIHFVPPMSEIGDGIHLTRTIEFPFAPYSGLAVHGKELDECPELMGFVLKNVVWDIDRQTFLAETFSVHYGSFFMIADEIRTWVDRGWRLGSYLDAYKAADEAESGEEEETVVIDEGDDDEWDEMERWPTMRPQKRPAHFNKLLRAMVRTMVELRNNEATAYAMAKTQLLFDDQELKTLDSPDKERFKASQNEYWKMPVDQQYAWQDGVKRKYPRLDRLVSEL